MFIVFMTVDSDKFEFFDEITRKRCAGEREREREGREWGCRAGNGSAREVVG